MSLTIFYSWQSDTPKAINRNFIEDALENYIIYEGLIENYDTKPTEILRPFLNKLWEECGLERPDKELL